MNNPLSTPNLRPFGTPTPVIPVSPSVPNGGAGGGRPVFDQNNLSPAHQQQRAQRPATIQERMQQQQEEMDPQKLAEQNNQHRIEKLAAEADERASRQNERLESALGTINKSVETQNQLNERLLRLEEQRIAMERAANQGPTIDELTALNPDEELAFKDALPVIEKTSTRQAHSVANQAINSHVNPRLQELEDKFQALESRTQDLHQSQANHFGAQLQRVASAHGIDLSTVESERSWIEFEGETSDALSGTKVKDVISGALSRGTPQDLDVLDRAFQRYAAKRDNRPVDQALPASTGQTRANPQHVPTEASPEMENARAEFSQLEEYRTSLLSDLRAKRISTAEFEQEIGAIEKRVEELIPT